MTNEETRNLIDLLRDKQAEYGDRLDAAGYLGLSTDPGTERVLLDVADDPDTDELLAEDCYESILNIWRVTGGEIHWGIFDGLPLDKVLRVLPKLQITKEEWDEHQKLKNTS